MKIKKISICIFLVVLTLIITTLLLFNNKNGKKEKDFSYTPIMYKVCDDNNCNYLVGSMHLGDEKIEKFNSIVLEAYNDSDALAVEVDTTDAKIDEKMFLISDNKTLDDYISESLKEKLEQFSQNHLFFPYEQYKKYIPGFIIDVISLLPYIENGMLNEGVDSYFLKLAHNENKEIISIETLESQLAFFTDYSDELYIKMLEENIDNYDKLKELSMELYKVYLTGDPEKIVNILNEEQTEENMTEEEIIYNNAMLQDRNVVMANAIESYLKNDKNVFVVVGAAHVVGKSGIIDILDNKGYKISLIK